VRLFTRVCNKIPPVFPLKFFNKIVTMEFVFRLFKTKVFFVLFSTPVLAANCQLYLRLLAKLKESGAIVVDEKENGPHI
jgi:hypothetical protein